MRIRVYPSSRCYQSLFDLLLAPFMSTKKFHEFFNKWLNNKPYLCTYRARNAIYHVIRYLKRNFHVSRVVVPSYICKDVITPIKMAGLDVVFADNNLKTLGIDFNSIYLKPNDVIIYPNLFGLKSAIPKNIDRKKVFIIEDNASSFLQPSSYADFTIYSFGKGKEVSSSEGGLIVVNKKKFENFLEETKLSSPDIKFEILRYFDYILWRLKTYRIIYLLGKKLKFRITATKKNTLTTNEFDGKNLSMCKISKNIAAQQLKKINKLQSESKELVKIFTNELNDLSILEPPESSNFFCLNLFVEKRDSLKVFLEKKQIYTSVYWDYLIEKPLNKNKPKKFSYILKHILQILIDPICMKNDDILYITNQIKEWQIEQNI